MTTQSKVGLDKQKHPERFCSQIGCLWKVTHINGLTGVRVMNLDCPGGRCPRHQIAAVAELERQFKGVDAMLASYKKHFGD